MSQPSLHHIGYVVPSIAADGARFAKSVAATWDERIIQTRCREFRSRFSYRPPAGQSTAQIELVEPGGENPPVLAFLSRGGGLHHLCYEVEV
jgi:hypothetical protein